jgi:crotonobetainyl-CoA:carnitine CoA-transferase CaiB-like acyl-CoA transferase
MTKQQEELPLSPYRCLDLSDKKGLLCGKILGDLGADVIKIEPPGGDPVRNIGPFFHNVPHPEKSLSWFAYNMNKRSITLNIKTFDGRHLLKRLIEGADFVIESFQPGYLDSLELGFLVLRKVNPRIILTSITPFGQTGPYKNHKASDITIMAMSGLMYVTGDSDRPPLRFSVPQSYPQAGAQAAVGTLIAHYHREISGEGQWVDISMQAALSMPLVNELPLWEFRNVLMHRSGSWIFRGNIRQRQVWPCRDGQVGFRLVGGVFAKKGIRPLIEWMKEEGMAGDLGLFEDWDTLDIAKMSPEQGKMWEEAIGNFFLKHTMEELQKEAVKRPFYLLPCNDMKAIAEDDQLLARDFWTNVEHPELNSTITYPGLPYRFNSINYQMPRRAPLIGEHNYEIYCNEMGLTNDDLITLKAANVI